MCYSWYLLLVQCLPFPVLGTVYLSWFPCDSAPLHPCNNVLLVPAHLHHGHLVLWSKRLISAEPPAGFGQWEIAEKYQRAGGWRLASLLPGNLHPLIPPCFHSLSPSLVSHSCWQWLCSSTKSQNSCRQFPQVLKLPPPHASSCLNWFLVLIVMACCTSLCWISLALLSDLQESSLDSM